MTPYEFGILLHYYGSPRDPEHYAIGTDLWIATVATHQSLGLLEPSGYQLTKKGDAFIEAALATPLPIQVWVIPRREPQP